MEDFYGFNLDQRLLKLINHCGWKKPTDIQEAVIPIMFERKCMIIQAKTGSGKTASYAIPLIQDTLLVKQSNRTQCTTSIVIAPTKELCNQATKNIKQLIPPGTISCVNVSQAIDEQQMRSVLNEVPDIIVGTPARIVAHLQNDKIKFDSLERIIIDEADLIFTFGFRNDIKQLKNFLPSRPLQVVLLSATLTDLTKDLRQSLIKSGEWVRVQLPDEPFLPSADQLTQYIVRADEDEKFVIIVALFKLKLLRGKTVIFVNSVDRCYKLRLFLEQFGIRAALLNSELPLSCRAHVFTQFNQGLYDILIATDESNINTNNKSTKQDPEYGVVRGLDFRLVSNVLNFDFPLNPQQYVHRVGRTARGDQNGTAMSLVSPSEESKLLEVVKLLRNREEESDANIAAIDDIFTPYQFKMSEIDGFRYRALDTKKKVTKALVREARLKEIKTELFNSEKLKAYFQEHTADLSALRHDKPLSKSLNKNLKNIPEYLVPDSLKDLIRGRPKAKMQQARKVIGKQAPAKLNQLKKQKNAKRKATDPLNSFNKKN